MALSRIGTKNSHHAATRMPIRHHGRRRTDTLADRRGLRPEGKDGPAGTQTRDPTKPITSNGRKTGNSRPCSKSRPVAGDTDLGQAYMDMTRPFVWTASKRDNFVS